MTRFYIGLGSNLGNRLANLRAAVDALGGSPGVSLGRRSVVWETRPLGPGTGPFLNAAVELQGSIDPRELLGRLLEIERARGRQRRERWGDRTLDLDLLCAYEDDGAELVVEQPGLTLPHPGFAARDFVLQPLVDIDPGLRIRGRSCREWLADIPNRDRTLLRRLDGPQELC